MYRVIRETEEGFDFDIEQFDNAEDALLHGMELGKCDGAFVVVKIVEFKEKV